MEQKYQWHSNEFLCAGTKKPRPLLIFGPSGSGKTFWACSLGTPCLIQSEENLDTSRPSQYTHLVFDEVNWDDNPNLWNQLTKFLSDPCFSVPIIIISQIMTEKTLMLNLFNPYIHTMTTNV